MKTCTNPSCQQINPQPLTEFYNHIKFGPRPECKSCSKARNSQNWKANKDKISKKNNEWRKQNKEKVDTKGRDYSLRSKFGITLETYNLMLEKQNNCCAVCNKHQSENTIDYKTKQPKRLAVDHDHKTGKVRQLLCDICNKVLGLIKEDVSILSKMQVYVHRHGGDNNEAQ